MPPISVHRDYVNQYIISMLLRDTFTPAERQTLEQMRSQVDLDIKALISILLTRYPNGRQVVPKSGNMHLAWEYAGNPANHHRFVTMLRVTPLVFQTLLQLIQDHPVFANQSNNAQTPVENQLAVTLFRLGRYGNGASVEDIARTAGCSEGSVERYTERCFEAIESLHDLFVRQLSREEKEIEKKWLENHLGFRGPGLLWREGWVMYDGTIVVLYKKPGLNGDAYYTRKANYGLNVQIGNTPSNLRIVDYSHGMTGSAHDATAFEHTTAYKYPDWFFEGEEFAWADSAYAVNSRTIPVHKQPASLDPANALFDKVAAHLRVRSEHCMGALKGRFQSLRGLRVSITSKREHHQACRWITIAIILHNLVIDVEGSKSASHFAAEHGPEQELEDRGGPDAPVDIEGDDAKRRKLVEQLIAIKSM